MAFVRKLTFKYEKPLILKSPPHTCRIKLLLGLFPGARFVHVHRNPYDVFSSRQRLDDVALRGWSMQRTDSVDWDGRIIDMYSSMYRTYFDEVSSIPPGQFIDVRYEELDRKPMEIVRTIYDALKLPDFGTAEVAMRAYLDSLAGYQKNVHPQIEEPLREKIADRWAQCFEHWGYR